MCLMMSSSRIKPEQQVMRMFQQSGLKVLNVFLLMHPAGQFSHDVLILRLHISVSVNISYYRYSKLGVGQYWVKKVIIGYL